MENIILTIFALIPILALIIGLGMIFYGGKDSLEQQSIELIKKTKPYTDVKKSITLTFKKNIYVLSWYLLYFIIIIPILVYFFGEIIYGPNFPYILLIILTGMPFLIAFIHIFAIADKQRYRLIASGQSIQEGSAHVLKWILLATGIMILVIYYILKLSNKFIP